MIENTILRFEDVGKLYRLGTIGTGTLSHDLKRWWTTRILHKEDPFLKIGETNDRTHRGSSEYVWALKNINLEIQQGDVVGIIGRNGAGKSTLLKLLSRVTAPTTGTITYEGRIASLLEVGTGFHWELTGRENVYMNGAIMGMTHKEIDKKFDEIVDFAGVERYIDTPVKRYSSGMTVRLGFAVAAFLEPDILVVDEVLAVGDAEFQRKAIGKMQDVASTTGRTVLFVSHNMGAVRSLCTSGVVMSNGQISFTGDINSAINNYISSNAGNDSDRIIDSISFQKDYINITNITINDTPLSKSDITNGQKILNITIEGETKERIHCELKVIFKTISEVPVASSIDGRCTGKLLDIAPGKFTITKTIRLPRYMAQGDYIVDLALHQPYVQDFFRANHCAQLHCDGSYEQFSHPIILKDEGFMSLESEETQYYTH